MCVCNYIYECFNCVIYYFGGLLKPIHELGHYFYITLCMHSIYIYIYIYIR